MGIKLNGVEVDSKLNQISLDEHGSYVLAEYPELWEVQRQNNFEFVVYGLEGIRKAGSMGTEENGTLPLNTQKIIRLSVVSAPIPHFTQNVIEVRRGNNAIKVAGVPTFGNGTLTVNDFIGADTKAVLMAWQNLSYNVVTEKVGLMSDYKKTAWLIEYTPDYQEVRKWILSGCWISGLSETDYNHENNEKHQISATIEYDKAVLDLSEIT